MTDSLLRLSFFLALLFFGKRGFFVSGAKIHDDSPSLLVAFGRLLSCGPLCYGRWLR